MCILLVLILDLEELAAFLAIPPGHETGLGSQMGTMGKALLNPMIIPYYGGTPSRRKGLDPIYDYSVDRVLLNGG